MRLGFIIPDQHEPWDSVHQGIGYVAAYAKKVLPVREVAVFRTHGRSEEDLAAFLARDWDVLALTMTAVTIGEAAHISRQAKKLARPPKIVIGGAHATSEEENIFTQVELADYIVIGEGEVTFAETVRVALEGGDPSQVLGLAWRDADGVAHKNAPRPWEQDLERFPPPDRTLFEYSYNFHSIIGTRGCPFACSFCNSSANWGRRYRVRKPSAIADEIRGVVELYGKDRFFAFNDDIFNVKKEWVLAVCEEIRKLNVRWWIRGLKAELVDAEMVDAFAASNCIGGACGVESADNTVLKVIGKGTTIEKVMRGVDLLYSRNMCLIGQFMIGNLGDTLETAKKSIAAAKNFKESTFGIAYPIPHTKLFDYVKQYGLMLEKPVPIVHRGKTIDWVLFSTPEFSVEDRVEAVRLALEAKVYHNVDYSKEIDNLPALPPDPVAAEEEEVRPLGRTNSRVPTAAGG
jgi:radical SAM superfamily enzyme YgiQ (UPF0313 family)